MSLFQNISKIINNINCLSDFVQFISNIDEINNVSSESPTWFVEATVYSAEQFKSWIADFKKSRIKFYDSTKWKNTLLR